MHAFNGNVREWRRQHDEAMEALEVIRTKELAAMTDEQAISLMMSLTVAEPPWQERPDWPGLVEQQAAFHGKKRCCR